MVCLFIGRSDEMMSSDAEIYEISASREKIKEQYESL